MSAVEQTDETTVDDKSGQVLLFPGQKFEGVKVTDYTLNIGGNIQLGDPELIKALTLGEEVTLRVKAHVVSRGHRLKKGKDNSDKHAAVSSANIVIDAVSLEDAE